MRRLTPWIVVALIGAAQLGSASPASAVSPTCARTVAITSVSQLEGTNVPPQTNGYTLFDFTVSTTAPCPYAMANAIYHTGHGSTDDTDLIGASGSLYWPPGDFTSRVVTVRVRKDAVNEPIERFGLYFCGTNGTDGFGVSEGVIRNDDGPRLQSPIVEWNYHSCQ
ncbi:hypothetical protein F4553_006893 [Allocatelliglobosispora scoriae]|uniref:Calx-beta domain-containing protein n=1 Tax=Allocatelliglobosispora scoriae TaxID=643052 RepID=A0A841C2D0_9ACTN|nr:hypothetical protein [Allocatelliglobosispora scoriae]MBB5873459.1 hypothetical protein [Allocatelliglobosispora scoriae]